DGQRVGVGDDVDEGRPLVAERGLQGPGELLRLLHAHPVGTAGAGEKGRAGPLWRDADLRAPASPLGLSARTPGAPEARATAAKSGFFMAVPCEGSPATSISNSTMLREWLLNSTTFTGRSYWTRVRKSPISMLNPPSPDMETTCRPRSVNCAPMAIGSAFA